MAMHSPVALGLAALFLTACAMALGTTGGTAPPAAELRGAQGSGPFRCVLTATDSGGTTAVVARLEARDAVTGRYDLRIRSGGAVVVQGGDVAAGAGEAVTLGEATLSGSAASLEADLTMTVGGKTTTCPVQRN